MGKVGREYFRAIPCSDYAVECIIEQHDDNVRRVDGTPMSGQANIDHSDIVDIDSNESIGMGLKPASNNTKGVDSSPSVEVLEEDQVVPSETALAPIKLELGEKPTVSTPQHTTADHMSSGMFVI